MNRLGRWSTGAASVAIAALVSTMPIAAETIGDWQVEAASTMCSAGTSANGASMILLTSKSGATGIMVKPADQHAITVGADYPIQLSLNGQAARDLTVPAIRFGGASVLLLPIPGAKIAAGEADGFAMKVTLNGAILFDKDMHGAHAAFASFVACSKTFGA